MGMAGYWIWWGLAALLVGAELMTGSFYLLAVGVAFFGGGLLALLGASVPWQMTIAAALAVLGTVVANRFRSRHARRGADPPLDVGQSVQVLAWKPDGTARVGHRGTQWDAELASPATARAEVMYIVGMRGSTLLIADQR